MIKKKPWINPNGASSERIIEQIKKCPSGALSYHSNNKSEKISDRTSANNQ
jgi:uncharacterized Fe-S cluster protein YjdI